MKKNKLVLAGLIALSLSLSSCDAENCSNLTKEKVEKILSEGDKSNIKVLSIKKTPIDDIYEVDVSISGKTLPLYMDCSGQYLFSGQIFDLKNKRNITQERYKQLVYDAERQKEQQFVKIIGKDKILELEKELPGILDSASIVDTKNIPETSIIFGNPQTKKVVYVITDPQCPFCAKLHESIMELLKERDDIAFKMIFYPLPFHQYAKSIAENIICSNDKSILDKSFESVENKDEKVLSEIAKPCDKASSTIEANIKYGQANGINGTPTIIFPNGLAISGAMSKDDLKKLIDIVF